MAKNEKRVFCCEYKGLSEVNDNGRYEKRDEATPNYSE